jgi:hypothetical protein
VSTTAFAIPHATASTGPTRRPGATTSPSIPRYPLRQTSRKNAAASSAPIRRRRGEEPAAASAGAASARLGKGAWCQGMRSDTRVPPPSAGAISSACTAPYSCSSRARVFAVPIPAPAVPPAAAAAIPTPSSRTSSVSQGPRRRAAT